MYDGAKWRQNINGQNLFVQTVKGYPLVRFDYHSSNNYLF